MSNVIEVENLRKTYGKTVAVDDVSFTVKKGEIFGMLGRNGAGKTTTVECMQALRHHDSGRIRVLGLDPLTQGRDLRRRIGSQLQESALPDRIKVWEAIDLFGSFAAERADWKILTEQWGLSDKIKTAFCNLSGGQRQRLIITLALVNKPEVVFLDEMTTGLDPAARHVAWDLVRAVRDQGATVILVTHFMDEAEQLCDRLAVIDKGRVLAIDKPQDLIIKHAGGIRVVFSNEDDNLDFLESVPCVLKVTRHGPRVEVLGEGAVLALTASALVEKGIIPSDLRLEQPSLEDVFLSLTHGSHLAED